MNKFQSRIVILILVLACTLGLVPVQSASAVAPSSSPGATSTISGHVTRNSNGQPVAGIRVQLSSSNYNWISPATTDSSGNWSISGLTTATYKIHFVTPAGSGLAPQWWQSGSSINSAQAISVTGGLDISNVNAALLQAASISGRVVSTDTTSPVSGINVVAEMVGSYSDNSAIVQTDSNGNYTIGELPVGNFKVRFNASGTQYVSEYSNNASSTTTATSYSVIANQSVTGVNASLETGASISGTITDANTGLPLSNARVWASSLDQNMYSSANATTNSSGQYTLRGLETSSYTLQFSPSNSADYLTEYWSNVWNYVDSTAVSVVRGQVLTGYNVGLTPPATISGTVTSAESPGTPVAGVYISLVDPVTFNNIGSATTAVDGTYIMTGLQPGTWTIAFDGNNANPARQLLLLGDSTSFTNASTVSLVSGQTLSGKNAVLGLIQPGAVPSAPLVTVTNPSGTQEVATWTQPSSSVPVLGYEISDMMLTAGGGAGGGARMFGTNPGTAFSDATCFQCATQTVSRFSTYRAVSSSAVSGPTSVVLNSTNGQQMQPAPTIILSTRTNNSLTISWADNSAVNHSATGWMVSLFDLDSSYSSYGDPQGSATSWSFTNLIAGHHYYFVVGGYSETDVTSWAISSTYTTTGGTPSSSPSASPSSSPTPSTSSSPTPSSTASSSPSSSPNVSPSPSPSQSSNSSIFNQGTNERFVDRLYRDFLNRPATSTEVIYWSNELLSGRRSQSDLTTTLSRSDEWIQSVIRGFYIDTLGREPDVAGYQYWIGRARAGMPIADIGSFFYGSDEYFSTTGQSNNTIWIGDLYQKLMSRQGDPGGIAFWVSRLNSGMSRPAVSHWFYQSPEKLGLRVDSLYSKLLSRNSDPGGRAYWAGRLLNEGDLSLASQLASSPEYFGK